jgi:tRNA threonylcarbamoyladenosine biosynthesis protein TsaB
LRIGISAAKGLSFSHDIPLYSESCTRILSYAASRKINGEKIFFCPLIDARRMEVYYSIYNTDLKELSPISAVVLSPEIFGPWLKGHTVVFFGNGMPKARPMLEEFNNAVFLEDIQTGAQWQLPLAMEKMEASQAENILTFEPYYVKDFMAKDPNSRINKVLNRS